MVFVHLDVYYWGPSSARNFARRWRATRDSLSIPLFAMGTKDDALFAKFVGKLGFKPLHQVPCTDGETRMLFVSWPKNTIQE